MKETESAREVLGELDLAGFAPSRVEHLNLGPMAPVDRHEGGVGTPHGGDQTRWQTRRT